MFPICDILILKSSPRINGYIGYLKKQQRSSGVKNIKNNSVFTEDSLYVAM